MATPSHGGPGAADPCRPAPADLLRNAATQYLTAAAEDASEAGRRLRWLADDERQEHRLTPEEWLTAAQISRLRWLADTADLVQAEALRMLAELAPSG